MKYLNNTILKVFISILLLVFLEFLITTLIYYYFPNSNMSNNVQIAIDLSLLLSFVISNSLLFKKKKGTNFSINLKSIFIYFIIALIWVYISPIFKFPFLLNNVDFHEFNFSIEKFQILNNKFSFSHYYLIRLLILTPFLEELFFRKVLLSNLYHETGFYKSTILISILFSISHLDFNNLLIFFIGSILLCVVYLKTNNIWYSITLHSFMNFITLLLC